MAPNSIDELLKVPASERIEIAMALWESLTDEERDAEFVLTRELTAELDRRWAEHEADPDSAIAWEDVKAKHRALR